MAAARLCVWILGCLASFAVIAAGRATPRFGGRRLAQDTSAVLFERPQGADSSKWGLEARSFQDRVTNILAQHFPHESPSSSIALDSRDTSKHHNMLVHLPRLAHALYRAQRFVQPNAGMLVLGDKGHLSVLVSELFLSQWLKYTSLGEDPGPLNVTASDGSIVSMNMGRHDVEAEPIPMSANTVDHVFFLEVLEHLSKDPFYSLLEIHRVLKQEGTLFISTPNLVSFTAAARALSGASPYTLSKFSVADGASQGITHTREYAWGELVQLLEVAGFSSTILSYNTYPADDRAWDHGLGQPQPQYTQLLASYPRLHQTLDRLGSTTFIVARKAWEPVYRWPRQLYTGMARNAALFTQYPACISNPSYCDGSKVPPTAWGAAPAAGAEPAAAT